MALEAKRAAVNTAMDTLAAAYDDCVDGLSPGDKLYIMPIWKEFPGVSGANIVGKFSTTEGMQHRITIPIPVATSDNSIRWLIKTPYAEILGGIPLVWYITNEAGEIA